MAEMKMYRFKAATGNGAVVDGSVKSTSSEQVKKDLISQGLIPVYVAADDSSVVRKFSLGNLLRLAGVSH